MSLIKNLALVKMVSICLRTIQERCRWNRYLWQLLATFIDSLLTKLLIFSELILVLAILSECKLLIESNHSFHLMLFIDDNVGAAIFAQVLDRL